MYVMLCYVMLCYVMLCYVMQPSWIVKASSTWGECLNYRGEREWGLVECRHSPQIALAFTNQDIPVSRIPRKNRGTVNSLNYYCQGIVIYYLSFHR